MLLVTRSNGTCLYHFKPGECFKTTTGKIWMVTDKKDASNVDCVTVEDGHVVQFSTGYVAEKVEMECGPLNYRASS